MIRSQKPKMPILAMIQNVSAGVWDGSNLARFFANPRMRRSGLQASPSSLNITIFKARSSISSKSQITRTRTCWPFWTRSTLPLKQEVAGGCRSSFRHRKGDYRAYAKASDYLILMAYDDIGPAEARPDCLAGLVRITRGRKNGQLDPARTIIAIGNYGVYWTINDGSTEALTFQDVMRRARTECGDRV